MNTLNIDLIKKFHCALSASVFADKAKLNMLPERNAVFQGQEHSSNSRRHHSTLNWLKLFQKPLSILGFHYVNMLTAEGAVVLSHLKLPIF